MREPGSNASQADQLASLNVKSLTCIVDKTQQAVAFHAEGNLGGRLLDSLLVRRVELQH